ncbi:hypothetical protein [Dendronalium sp. ChiSLP03b]
MADSQQQPMYCKNTEGLVQMLMADYLVTRFTSFMNFKQPFREDEEVVR